MSEVTLVFQGMVLLWATSTPPVVLVPDLSKMSVSHTSTISAPKSAFKGGACLAPFLESADGSTCAMVLSEDGRPSAGNTGGVQIELASAAAVTAPMSAAAMCALPRLQQPSTNTKLMLLPAFSPPSGSGNAAWMRAIGGTSSAIVTDCDSTTPGDCPRYLQWSVPVAKDSNAILVLRNIAGVPGDFMAEIVAGSQLLVTNIPSESVLAERAQLAKESSQGGSTDPVLESKDWCMYFQMVTAASGSSVTAKCPGVPPIPTCTSPRVSRTSHKHATPDFETIACSSSQYP